MDVPVLVLPGYGNSGPEHWQTLWQARHPAWRRVNLGEWEAPRCDDWIGKLERAVLGCPAPPILVAHSLACLLVAHWACRSTAFITNAFLVAVPDPSAATFPSAVRGFAPVPMEPFAFRSLVVGSSNDPFGSVAHARRCAGAWGSRFVDIGHAGHINSESGYGEWVDGYALFQELAR